MLFSMNYFNGLPVNTISLYILIFVLLTIVLLLMLFLFRRRFKGKKKNIILMWMSIIVLIGFILFITGSFGRFVNVKSADSKGYSKSELIEDLQQVEAYIMKENPLIFTKKEELTNQFAETYAKIEEGMTELEFYRLINPLVVAVNCGHTNLSISAALQKNREETAKYFPLDLTLIDNELYVLDSDKTSGIESGDRITEINGKSSKQIIKILLNNISGDGDNKVKQRYIISKHFNSRFYDFVDNSNTFYVKYINEAGVLKTTKLKAKYRSEYNTTAWGLHFSDYQDGNYYEDNIYDKYAVLKIKVFMPEKDGDFASFLDKFFLNLKKNNISQLIIDLRGNFGASPHMAKTLLSHLVDKKTEYFTGELTFLHNLLGFNKPIVPSENIFDGKLVVLTDGAGFSTTGHFCAMVKYYQLGTLVGTETAGTYICTDSSKDAVLKNTRMRLHYSTMVYEVGVEGFSYNKGIKPDIQVRTTIDSILNDKDIQMERSLQFLRVE